ncbi:hypothetical protein DHEL01_v211287 [Diaporthe helianthi]|uniref:Uncharacterized protein n=1 Tax=Diaporthe helianthi TaxID=158607 RepID=A0A2P5HJ89_DIAHE|nr:hypothetical protein DHEL01_v211287 [Diaporthe helianthi]
MVSVRMLTLISAVAAAVSAAPAPIIDGLDAALETLNITETVDRDLRRGELLVIGAGGRSAIVTEATWKLLLEVQGIAAEPPEIDYEYLNNAGKGLAEIPVNDTELALGKRECDNDFAYKIDGTINFVDWDVQMSPVIAGAGSKGIEVTVARSFTVQNSITGGGGVDLSKLYPKLGLAFKIDYAHQWSTTQGTMVRATVDSGEVGCVITRPYTTRRYGRTYEGCLGSQKVGTFYADSHAEGSYEGYTWISGTITACIKKQRNPRLTRCNGAGYFR